jgi:predicted enzyme related to lactoylglutathione lyase
MGHDSARDAMIYQHATVMARGYLAAAVFRPSRAARLVLGRQGKRSAPGALGHRHPAWQYRPMLQILGFIIDCPDPMKLAVFYSEVTGRAIMEGSGDDMAAITLGKVDLAFQRVEDYRPPRWPDDEHPKQYHLDFEVDEIEPEQRRVVKLGATLQKDFIGPEGYGWQVYTDPAGHPFCLCRHEGATWTDKGVVWP